MVSPWGLFEKVCVSGLRLVLLGVQPRDKVRAADKAQASDLQDGTRDLFGVHTFDKGANRHARKRCSWGERP